MLIDANRFDLLEELILAEPLRHGQPVVLIDGRSGAGKTTLANTLICHHADWQLVHADDLYPGWSGLSAVWDLRISSLDAGTGDGTGIKTASTTKSS